MPPVKRNSRARLGVADHPFDGRELLPQRAFEVVDFLVDGPDRQRRIDAAVKVDDLSLGSLAYAHVVDLSDESDIRRDGAELLAYRRDPFIRRVAAGEPARLQRLDVGFDLDFRAELGRS